MTATRVQCHTWRCGWKCYNILVCVRGRDRGRRETTVAAVEEIIPGLDLSLSNRNSYDYCGSIRLKRQKKKSSERGRECISSTEVQQHNAGPTWNTEAELSQTQCCGCLFFAWFKKRKLPAKQIFYFCFSSWAAILSVSEATRQTQKHWSSNVTPKACLSQHGLN